MKKIILSAAALVVSLSVMSQKNKQVNSNSPVKTVSGQPKGPGLKNGIDSFSYAAGVNIATNMKEQGIAELNLDAMLMAFKDVFDNKTLLMNNDQCGQTLQQKMKEFNEKKSAGQKQGGIDFLNKNKTREGVKTTASGLQYEVLDAGDLSSILPTASDTVVVHYAGTLIDGKEFDNSFKRGEPATFPLGGVIKGWTEALQLMHKGAKYKVYLPYELAYGERGAGGSIPPYSTLIFEINLIDIKPADIK